METAIIRGITYTVDEAKVTVRSVPDQRWRRRCSAPWPTPRERGHDIQNVSERPHRHSLHGAIDDLAAATTL